MLGGTPTGGNLMARLFLAAVAFLSFDAAPPLTADETPAKRVEIPLSEVWALRMPGTRDLRELVPDDAAIESVRRRLQFDPRKKQASRGFAVSGTAIEAFQKARAILEGCEKPKARFPKNTEIAVVFFSYESPLYVHLDKVEREREAVRIGYRFVPHQSKETTHHFAIIPLGKLPPGRYGVRVKPQPMEKKYTDAGFTNPSHSAISQLVSGTFHFIVTE